MPVYQYLNIHLGVSSATRVHNVPLSVCRSDIGQWYAKKEKNRVQFLNILENYVCSTRIYSIILNCTREKSTKTYHMF